MITPFEDPCLHDSVPGLQGEPGRPPPRSVRHGPAGRGGQVEAPVDAHRIRPRRVIEAVGHAVAASAAARAGVALLTRVVPPPCLQLSRHDVVVPRLPARLDGLRVLHLSDLHLHPGPQVAWQIPALIAAVPHDLVCYTGDFIDSDEDLPRLARFLAQMPRAAPAYAVLGNHDYTPYGRGHGVNDVRRIRETLSAAGITVLTNEARPLFGGGLHIAGVDDPATRRDDLDRAMAGVPAAACSLLLAHSPDVVLGTRRPSVILAGHTHGGQIRLPLVGALLTESRLPRRLAMGLHSYQGAQLFVSRGVGYSGLDIRIGCPPEVALLTLRSPAIAVRYLAGSEAEGRAPGRGAENPGT